MVIKHTCSILFYLFLFINLSRGLFGKWGLGLLKYDRREKLSLLNGEEASGFNLTDEEVKKFKIWPDGVIPYYIDVPSYSDKVLRDRIRGFLGFVNSVTSLNFIEMAKPPRDRQTRWVFFVNRRRQLGCGEHSVKNFNISGVQKVTLGYDCMHSQGELAEAVLAIVGVPAQHNAPNRDDYIKVNIENIMPDKIHLFEKLRDDEWLFHDLPYDFDSVGHYDSFKYSAQGRAVIEPLNLQHTLGEKKELSDIDLRKIRMLYNFITKKKRLNLSECEKMFMKNSNFDDYKVSKGVIIPFRKPNKYLGLPDKNVSKGDEQELGSDEKGSVNSSIPKNSKDKNATNEDTRDETTNNEESKDKIIEIEETIKIQTPDSEPYDSKNIETNREPIDENVINTIHKSTKTIIKLKNEIKTIDPLTYLSDYISSQ